ncbi:unnamed protein product [Caenorhabditis bovis]|uniref:Major facilitator superfamily (MFS) profile domain-containing protein n=1 Tax=Caenorhabditis bovis TaxID=2654633 RepID=A0A8S1EUQ7_9PELO|nr:unnamed protein product [Caenorhabditis bovis]
MIELQPQSPLMECKTDEARSLQQLLEKTSGWRPYPLFITCSMAFLWALCALSAISPAFTAPAEPCTTNCTFYTIHQDFNLTNYAIDPAELSSSIYFFGNLCVGQFFATLADRFGRRPIILASLMLTGVAGSLGALASNFPLLLLARFVQGSCYTPLTMVNYVLCSECIPNKSMSLASMFFGISWVLGYCFLAPLSILFPTWRLLQLATAIPNVVIAVFLFFTLPESVAYSIERKNRKSVKRWIRMNEMTSRRAIPHNLDDIMSNAEKHQEQTEQAELSIWQILRRVRHNSKILKLMLNETFIWILTFMNYCALALTSTSVGDSNPLISFLFSGIVEFPAYIFIPIILRYFPRKPIRILCHALGAVALTAMYFQATDSPAHLTIWLLGKFSASCCYMSCFINASDLFPVFCRTCCIGVCSTLCNIGSIIAPYIFTLDKIAPNSQFICIALSNLICVILIILQYKMK